LDIYTQAHNKELLFTATEAMVEAINLLVPP